jgi:hypothetical protein
VVGVEGESKGRQREKGRKVESGTKIRISICEGLLLYMKSWSALKTRSTHRNDDEPHPQLDTSIELLLKD